VLFRSQAFSTAGAGEGRGLLDQLAADITAGQWDAPYPEKVRHVLQVGRWAETLRPEWIACEQVPPVLPLWHLYADLLRTQGYSAWAGILNAADYGVPQTRRRAILIAAQGHPVAAPSPTHAQGGAATLFGTLRPWVSMAEALGWVGEDTPARTLCGDRSPRWLYPDKDGTHGRVVVRTGANSMVTGRTNDDLQPYERSVDQPAPTLDSKVGSAWTLNRRQQTNGVPVRNVPDVEPAPTLTGIAGSKGQWVWERPATTVAGDPRLSGPGRNDPNIPGSQYGPNSVKLTIAEALILQSFPADYPVQGTKTKQFEQVGNAVPPLLAAHILAAVTGRRLEQDVAA